MTRANLPSVLLLVGAGLLGGAVGATGAVLAGGEPAEPAPSAGASQPALELASRLDALAAENEALRSRMQELELRPPPTRREPALGFVTRETFESFRAEVLARLDEREPRPEERVAEAAPGAELEAKIADTLQEIRHREAVTKVRAYQEQRRERLDADVERIREWLELEPYQVDGMRRALVAQYEREDEQRRLWEEGTDDAVLATRKREDVDLFRVELEDVLAPDQLETFWTKVAGPTK